MTDLTAVDTYVASAQRVSAYKLSHILSDMHKDLSGAPATVQGRKTSEAAAQVAGHATSWGGESESNDQGEAVNGEQRQQNKLDQMIESILGEAFEGSLPVEYGQPGPFAPIGGVKPSHDDADKMKQQQEMMIGDWCHEMLADTSEGEREQKLDEHRQPQHEERHGESQPMIEPTQLVAWWNIQVSESHISPKNRQEMEKKGKGLLKLHAYYWNEIRYKTNTNLHLQQIGALHNAVFLTNADNQQLTFSAGSDTITVRALATLYTKMQQKLRELLFRYQPTFHTESPTSDSNKMEASEETRSYDLSLSSENEYSEQHKQVLENWFLAHLQYPYPTEDEKEALAIQSGRTIKQVEQYFSNKRSRFKRKALSKGQNGP
jgi:hypothetical protein